MSSAFPVDVEEVAKEILEVARDSVSEEDLKQGVEYVLRSKVIERLKMAEKTEIPYASWRPPRARYEVTLVSGLRADALYGHLIIEYERPRTFDSRSGFEKAVEQVKSYIVAHAEVEARFPRYFGVVLDGYKIGFVRYRETIKGFESKGPFEVNRNTVAKLIEAIIGLRRKALGAEELLKDFGPESSAAREAIKALYNKLLRATPRTEMLFEDWRRVFSQVCAYSPDKIRGLEEVYGFKRGEADPEKLLFALHTYYALIMKLLAAEVASLYVAPKLLSYLRVLEDAYYSGHERLREKLRELEEGGVFTQLKITNFMEADYFAWYLDEWDEAVAECIMGIIRKLSDYDPSAADLEPERIRDLFKRLYQNLVPKKIRHDLGEYYTPDWLAELVLNEVGWTLETFEKVREEKKDALAPLDLRLLDPACGSGTFLVLAIGRLRQYVEEHWVDKGAALRRITKNIVGFDLNPLAVIASRTNYLIALGDMLRERGDEPIEIPVYLADSILVERRQTLTGAAYILKTTVGEFSVPVSVVEKGFLAKTLTVIEECIKGNYSSDEFKARLFREVSLEENEISVVTELFGKLMKLEKEGRNRIWARILKNCFAPLFAGKFDYVVGNPPWVLWDNLPDNYRNSTRLLWQDYGLFTLSGLEARHGGGKKDISVLFTYACVDRYLKEQGSFGFLMTQSVFKSRGAGEGFRRFKLKDIPLKVRKVHDFVALKPFEGANNRATAIFLSKNGKTEYPVPYIVWRQREAVEQSDSLDVVLRKTERVEMLAKPSDDRNVLSPWLTLPRKIQKVVERFRGRSHYRCYAGIYSGGANAVYWFRIIELQGEKDVGIDVPLHLRRFFGKKIEKLKFVCVENVTEGMKKDVKSVKTVLEDFFLYSLIKSQHIEKWGINGYIYTLQMQDPIRRIGYDEYWVKVNFPKTYAHLKSFENLLKTRSSRVVRELMERGPFYSMYAVGDYTYAPFKVVWNQMGNRLTACVVSFANDPFLGEKIILPEHVLAFIPTDNEDEAHYLCAILNSSIADLILRSIAGGTKSFGTPKIIEETLNLKRYDATSRLHTKLTTLSKKAHKLVQQNQEDELRKVEEEIDKTVAQLYGIAEDELEEVRKCLAMLEGEETGEEGEEVVDLPPTLPDISLRNNVVGEGKPFDVEVVVSNSFDKPLTNVSVKLKLFDGRLIEKSFESVEGEVSFPISFDGLKAGEYKIETVFNYVFENTPKRVEKNLTIYVKGGEVKHVERSFKPEELLGV
jgi:hypothetical protein